PGWGDGGLFEHARLVNAALIAKIHTVEWTPALLGDPIMQTGMRVNWWGFMGERFARRFGRIAKSEGVRGGGLGGGRSPRRFGRIAKSEEVSGIPGSETHHHGVPYAMTEEFVAV